MEGFRVRCRTCGAVLYETTKKYTCHKPLTGDMLRLLPLYKDWPCYDGSLAVKSTSRFLMFCSQCAGYISTTGKLTFADFPDEKVTVISKERSEMPWWDLPVERGEPAVPWKRKEDTEYDEELSSVLMEAVDDLILPYAEDSALSDDLRKTKIPAISPDDLMKKLDKQSREVDHGRKTHI